jgi:hypothetical protein
MSPYRSLRQPEETTFDEYVEDYLAAFGNTATGKARTMMQLMAALAYAYENYEEPER